jgi:hypothetical protein
MFKTHRTFDLTTGVKNKTIAVFADDFGNVKVLYHKTIVFDYDSKFNRVKLSNGGWDTVSTRIVINNALSKLGQHDVFLERKKNETFLNLKGERYPFVSDYKLFLDEINT